MVGFACCGQQPARNEAQHDPCTSHSQSSPRAPAASPTPPQPRLSLGRATAAQVGWHKYIGLEVRTDRRQSPDRLKVWHCFSALGRPWCCAAPLPPAGGGYRCSLHKLAMTQGQEAAEWNQTDCNATTTYTGLPNGSYKFRVQARGCQGRQRRPPALTELGAEAYK